MQVLRSAERQATMTCIVQRPCAATLYAAQMSSRLHEVPVQELTGLFLTLCTLGRVGQDPSFMARTPWLQANHFCLTWPSGFCIPCTEFRFDTGLCTQSKAHSHGPALKCLGSTCTGSCISASSQPVHWLTLASSLHICGHMSVHVCTTLKARLLASHTGCSTTLVTRGCQVLLVMHTSCQGAEPAPLQVHCRATGHTAGMSNMTELQLATESAGDMLATALCYC